MRVVFLLFDSLNRLCLSPYGGTRVKTPNFDRLAERSATFDAHYVGSMPCMPARRDMLTGRLSFLHRSWGPLEPFDDAFPEVLSETAGVYSHLVTDHAHYWEDGGATYHNRYDSFEFVRGQEGDAWKAMVQPPWERLREMYAADQISEEPRSYKRNNVINREFIRAEEDFPSVQVISHGLDFLERNNEADNWVLQIETFDPHEPFTTPASYMEAYDTGWDGPIRDWPRYGRVEELPAEGDELRANYYACVALCDAQLGRILDAFDRLNLWDDTALVVTTDHGFLLGEHDFWAKNRMNIYEEVARVPLFIHDPRHPMPGQRVSGLSQTPDLAATMYDFFDATPPQRLASKSLTNVMRGQSNHDAVLFGYFGGAVNLADGKYTYHRYPPDLAQQEIYQYTLMPTHIDGFFHREELAEASMVPGIPFTSGLPVMRVPMSPRATYYDKYGPGALIEGGTRLYDLAADPGQEHPVQDQGLEARLSAKMVDLMVDLAAPPEAFDRLCVNMPAMRFSTE